MRHLPVFCACIIICCSTLSAESQRDWLEKMATSPATQLHRFSWAADQEANKALRAAANESRKLTVELGRPPAASEQVSSDGKTIRIGPHRLKLGDWPEGDKKAAFYVVARYVFDLPADGRFWLQVDKSCAMVMVNGERGVYTGHGMWSDNRSGRFGFAGRQGRNEIILANDDPDRGPPTVTPVPRPDHRAYADHLRDAFSTPINDDKADAYRDFLRQMAEYIAIDGAELATGAEALVDHYDRQARAKSDERDKIQRALGSILRDLCERMVFHQRVPFLLQLRDHCPPWVFDETLIASSTDIGFLYTTLTQFAYMGLADEIPSLVRTAMQRWNRKIENDKKFADGFSDKVRDLAKWALNLTGDFPVALDILKRVEDITHGHRDVKSYRSIIDQLELSDRTKMQLNYDPEAAQHYFEFKLLMERGPDDEAAIGSAFSLFRKAGSQLRQDGLHVRGLQSDLDAALRGNEAFREVLRSHAQERLAGIIDNAKQRGALEVIDDIIVRYRALIDTAPLHRFLLRERFDRGQRDDARHHAVFLLNERDPALQVEAMATLMLIEHQAGTHPHKRTSLPDNLERRKLTFKGEEITLGALERQLWGTVAQTTQVQGEPGSLVAAIPLPAGDAVEVGGSNHYAKARPVQRQPLEPARIGDRIMLSTPLWTLALDPERGSVAWKSEAPLLAADDNRGFKQSLHPVTDVGHAGIVLRRGDGYHLRAFDRDGNRVWNSSDHQISAEWMPYTTPITAFGSTFLLVRKRTLSDAIQVGMARLDTENGRFDDVIPIDNMSVQYGTDRMLYDAHFTTDQEAFYGFTGTGAVFRIDAETLQPVWVACMIRGRDRRGDTPPGYIQSFGRQLVCWLPSVQTWAGLRSSSGDVLWRFQQNDCRFIHSRGNDQALIISYDGEARGDLLVRLDPHTGHILWQRPTHGLTITGEGCVVGDRVWLPTDGGILAYDLATGAQRKHLPIGEVVANKLRMVGDRWCLFSEAGVHLLRSDGAFPATGLPVIDPAAPEKIETGGSGGYTDLKRPSAELRLALPFDEPRWHNTDIDGMHLILDKTTPAVGLLREGFEAPDGTYRPPTLLWRDSLPEAHIDDGRLLTYDRYQARVLSLPDREILYTYGHQGGHPAIDQAHLTGNLLAVRRDHHSILIDITSGEVLGHINSGTDIRDFTRDFAIVASRHHIARYDWADGGKRWDFRKPGRFSYYLIDGQVVGWTDKDWYVFDMESGKPKTITRPGGNHWGGLFHHDGTIYTRAAAILDIDKGTARRGGKRILLGHDGALEVHDDKLIWHDRSGDYELPGVGDHWTEALANHRHQREVRRSGQHLAISCEQRLFIYDLESKERIFNRNIAGWRDKIQQILDRSFVVDEHRSPLITLLRQRTTRSLPVYTQVCSRPVAADERGWPQDGWLPPQAVPRSHWLGVDKQEPTRQYQTQIGVDTDHVYIRLIAGPAPDGIATDLDISPIYMHSGRSFHAFWSIDTAAEARVERNAAEAVVSWSEREEDGSHSHYMRIDRTRFEGDRQDHDAPRIHWRITERRGDETRGWYRIGGLTTGDQKRQPIDPLRRIEGQRPDNYSVRKQLYEQSTAFVPQGEELARWLTGRRVRHGFDGNLSFLREMAARTKENWCVTNVLAAMVVERIEQLRADPEAPDESDPAFVRRIHAITGEVNAYGEQLGIPEDWRKRACSLITLVVHPTYGNDAEQIDSLAIRHGRGNHWRNNHWWLPTGSASYLCGAQSRPYMMVLPLGLFAGDGDYDWKSLRLRGLDHWTGFSHYALVQPGGIDWWFTPDGTVKLELKNSRYANWHQVSEEDEPGPAVKVERTSRRGDIRDVWLPFGEIDTGAVPEDTGIDAENLLLTLRNLPTDSRIAIDIIDSYRRTAKDDPDRLSDLDCYRIALGRVGGQWNQLSELTDRMKHLLDQQYPGNGHRVFDKLHELMSEANISRAAQRHIAMRHASLFGYHNRMANLGPVPSGDTAPKEPEAEAEAEPEAEVVAEAEPILLPDTERDPLARDYTFGGKRYQWQVNQVENGDSKLRNDVSDVDGRWVIWHAARFKVVKRSKIFIYLGRDEFRRRRRNRTTTQVDVSIDGFELAQKLELHRDDEHRYELHTRLPAGEHVILFKVSFRNDWDFHCHIGDSWGVPLEDLEWQDLDIR